MKTCLVYNHNGFTASGKICYFLLKEGGRNTRFKTFIWNTY